MRRARLAIASTSATLPLRGGQTPEGGCMGWKSLVHAASLAGLLLVLPGAAASAGSPGPAAVAGTSYVFHAYANAIPAQGIGMIRADENAGTLTANLYFRKLA